VQKLSYINKNITFGKRATFARTFECVFDGLLGLLQGGDGDRVGPGDQKQSVRLFLHADHEQLGVACAHQGAALGRVLEAPAAPAIALLHLDALVRLQDVAPRHVLALDLGHPLATLLGQVEGHQETGGAHHPRRTHPQLVRQPRLRLVDALDLQQRRVGAAGVEAHHLGGEDEVGVADARLVGRQPQVEVVVDDAGRHLGRFDLEAGADGGAARGPQHQGPQQDPHFRRENRRHNGKNSPFMHFWWFPLTEN